MQNKTSIVSLSIAVISIICVACLYLSRPKITYVRSSELIDNYAGMKQARLEYEKKSNVWKANVDTLEYDFQQSINKYNKEIAHLSEKERAERESKLNIQRQSFLKYKQSISEKAREEEEKMTVGVLNQINSFVEEYGRKHGYLVVLGTTASGNILYADDAINITPELLKALNESYKDTGKPSANK